MRLLKQAWAEFKLLFKDPRDIHRVLVIVPLAALASHVIYLYMQVTAPFTQDELITVYLGATIYLMLLSWCFLSNPIHFDLFWRFLFTAGLAVLAHRIGVMANETGGSLYFKFFSFFSIGVMMVFSITGKNKNELKAHWHEYMEKRRTAHLGYIPPANTDSDQPFVS